MSAEKSVRCPLCNRDPTENNDNDKGMSTEARLENTKTAGGLLWKLRCHVFVFFHLINIVPLG